MKFANFSSTAALAVALLAASANAGYPDEADGHVNRRLPAGGNGNGQGQGQGQGNGKPGADDDEIGVIVVWKNANGRNELNNFAKDQKVNDISSKLGISALKTFRGNWNALKNNPNFESVEIDAEVHALPYFRGGNDEESDHQQRRLAEETPYGITMVQSALLPPNPTGSKKICVVDTGYALGHEDLPDASYGVNGYVPSGYSGSWNVDGDGHGTHCAGTIGAIGGNGKGVTSVNPDPSKFSFFIGKGLQDNGSGSTSGVMDAVTACKNNGANVISMSLGGGGFTNAENTLYKDLYNNDDVLIIAAAGNDGNSAKSYPASYNAVMSVAAVDSNENKASFSQYNEQVEIAGPGVNVKSTLPNNQYASYSGTSMATPHVAGVAGLVWSHFPDCKAWQIRNVLVKTAKEAGPAGCDNQYGFGIVQAKAAYDLLAAGGCAAGGSSDTASPVGGCARENLLSCSSSSECNDSNPCTTDTCSNSVCVHTVSDPTCTHCGNGVCEAGEDTGNCPTDCPCVDNPEGWYDADGPTYSCAWYGSESTYCSSYGDSYANFGTTANQACCVCGGGSPTSGGPTSPTPVPPTNPPPTNPPPTNPPPTNPPPTNPPPTNPPPTNPPPTNPPPTNPPPTNPPPTNPPPTNPPPTNPPPTNPPPTNPPPTNPPPTNPPPTNSPPSSCIDVTVEIRTDYWGWETSWALADTSSNTPLMEGSSYGNSQTYYSSKCLDNDTNYVFTIYDTYGDGLYYGSYSVTAGTTVLASGGGNFGYSEVTNFVLGNPGPSPCNENECSDTPAGWHDIDGPYYDCAWYAQGSNCADFGDYYANFGKTANQACCACGGGGNVCSASASPASSSFVAAAEANARKKPGNLKKTGTKPKPDAGAPCPRNLSGNQCSADCHCPGSFCKGNGSCK